MIIGLGSGRCGTMTLSKILGLPHEAKLLPWDFDEERFARALKHAERNGGAVGCFWLNYVEPLLERYPKTKFICLKRDRDATVKSWVRHMKGHTRFRHESAWTTADGRRHVESKFPDYGDLSIPEAAAQYYDDYYGTSEKLADLHPESFRMFVAPDVFNKAKPQRKLLAFCGLRARRVRLGIRSNATPDPVRQELTNIIKEESWKLFRKGGADARMDVGKSARVRELSAIMAAREGKSPPEVVDVTIHAR